ncbi:MAG: hypothetical protein H3Z53_03505 [archaeon]|nr:hypothetical protein [archaeon]MCP8313427.1 hypothetical protein [archaeon]MCP8317226.1 hypothetical protein [archaeon]MCP8320756.1 hypothetical protein [archaeon]
MIENINPLEKETGNINTSLDSNIDRLAIKDSTILSPSEKFENCKNIGDVFELIKETTERFIGLRRAGLTLYLVDLPMNIGGFHQIGSNVIVMNRTLLKAIESMAESKKDVNSFVYLILLHEYLHALGYAEEWKVRELVYNISMSSFGQDHDITKLAKRGFSYILEQISHAPIENDGKIEIVKDFDRSSMSYIG